jgi:hypothetical protein
MHIYITLILANNKNINHLCPRRREGVGLGFRTIRCDSLEGKVERDNGIY